VVLKLKYYKIHLKILTIYVTLRLLGIGRVECWRFSLSFGEHCTFHLEVQCVSRGDGVDSSYVDLAMSGVSEVIPRNASHRLSASRQ
jgi:hypothetical protein